MNFNATTVKIASSPLTTELQRPLRVTEENDNSNNNSSNDDDIRNNKTEVYAIKI